MSYRTPPPPPFPRGDPDVQKPKYWNDGGKLSDQAAEIATLRARVTELERERDQCLEAAGRSVVRAERAEDRAETAEARVAELIAATPPDLAERVRELEKALRPFADYWNDAEFRPLAGEHYRRAARAMEGRDDG